MKVTLEIKDADGNVRAHQAAESDTGEALTTALLAGFTVTAIAEES